MRMNGRNRRFSILAAILLAALLGCGVYLMIKAAGKWSATPYEAIGRVRTDIGQILYEKKEADGITVFSLRQGRESGTLHAEYVHKGFFGWKWGYGGMHSVPRYEGKPDFPYRITSWTYQFLPFTEGTEFRSPFPMAFGIIQNPGIDSIRVLNLATGEEEEAQIAMGSSDSRVWYAMLDQGDGMKFRVSAYAGAELKSEVEFDEEALLTGAGQRTARPD